METEIVSYRPPKNRAAPDYWASLGIGDAETSVTEAIHQGLGPEVYQNLVTRIALSQSEFHRITGIPVSTIKRRLKNNERFSTQESDAMYRLALLVKLASELFEDESQALVWIREGIYGLGGNRPLDMVSTTVDFELVKDLIGRMEHGVVS